MPRSNRRKKRSLYPHSDNSKPKTAPNAEKGEAVRALYQVWLTLCAMPFEQRFAVLAMLLTFLMTIVLGISVWRLAQ